MTRNWLAVFVALIVITLSGCGGGGGGGSNAGNSDGDPSASADDATLLVVQDDDHTPITLLNKTGQSALLHRTDNDKFDAFTLFGPDGSQVDVSVDPATGMPLELVADGVIFQIGNINLPAGTADMAIIDREGEIEFFRDISYLEFASGIGQPILTGPATSANFVESKFDKRTHGAFSQKTPEQVMKDLERASQAFSVAWDILSCTMGATLTAGAAVGAAVDPVKVFGVTLFQASASATTFVCGKAVVAVWKEKYPTSVNVQTAENTLQTAEELKGLGENLGEVWAACRARFSFKKCKDSITSTAEFGRSGTVNRLQGSYIRGRDGIARISQFSVYCCNGPRRLVKDQQGRWTAALIDGLGTPRYTFDFNWGDGNTLIVTDTTRRRESHSYPSAGDYEINVTVSDSAGNSDSSTTPIPTQADQPPFSVTVIDELLPLAPTLDGPTTVLLNKDTSWSIGVDGGLGPFKSVLDWNNGETNNYLMSENVSGLQASHTFTEPGIKNLKLTVDDMGVHNSSASAELAVLVIAEAKVDCCEGPDSLMVDTEGGFSFTTIGVELPYQYVIDLGNGKTISGESSAAKTEFTAEYPEPGMNEISVSVTGIGQSAIRSEAHTVNVTEIDNSYTVYRISNYSGDGYLTIDLTRNLEMPPLLRRYPGGGIDTELRAEWSYFSGTPPSTFATRDEARASLCGIISCFYRPSLARFIQKADTSVGFVGIDSGVVSACPTVQNPCQ